MPKLWMSGVETLCAIGDYRAALFYFRIKLCQLTMLKTTVFSKRGPFPEISVLCLRNVQARLSKTVETIASNEILTVFDRSLQ